MISIIIPVYNVEEYLQQCINSIILQTNQNFELILVNDGSLDKSGDICDSFAKEHSRIKVFHKENGGVSSARNLGIKQSTGEYIWFVDPDDWIAEDALKCLEAIAAEQNPDLVVFSHLKFLENNYKETVIPVEIDKTTISDYLTIVRSFRPNVWCYLYKTSLIKDTNAKFPGQSYFEDEIFNMELFKKANSIVQIKNKLYFYRERENSAMTKPFSEERLSSYINLLRNYKIFAHNFHQKDFMWKNIFIYVNNVKSGMSELKYSENDKQKIVSEMKAIFKKIKFLKSDTKGVLLLKFLYNYFPNLFTRI